MELTKDKAYDVLGLTPDSPLCDVIRRYKYLALQWFPDNHDSSSNALEKFQQISKATLQLLDVNMPKDLTLEEMIHLFKSIFFGKDFVSILSDSSDSWEGSSDERSDEDYDLLDDGYMFSYKDNEVDEELDSQVKAKYEESEQNAQELIQEEKREKKRAERRKAQKKRRKERKKQQKMALKEKDDSGNISTAEQKGQDSSESESEEEVDPNSAFVASIAKVQHILIPNKKENVSKSKSAVVKEVHKVQVNDKESKVLRSRELAVRGNEMAGSGHYQEAMELFTEAIKMDSRDYRFYGNRSFCYERLGMYERAAKDGEKCIALEPKAPKGYFRKGKALASLKKYAEAEKCFAEVLKLDKNCDDAVKELLLLRIKQLTDMGFSKEEAEVALEEYGTVDRALEHLLSKSTASMSVANDLDVFLSDDDDSFFEMYTSVSRGPSSSITQQPAKSAPDSKVTDIKMDPRNPEGYNSIWVGNIQPGVTEKMVESLFSKYGALMSVKVMSDKFCAFVNYKNKTSAGMAMQALQGVDLCGANLYIRFPNLIPKGSTKTGAGDTQKATKVTMPSGEEECFFWRTTGCIYGDHCRYKHLKEHKGVDKKKYMIKS